MLAAVVVVVETAVLVAAAVVVVVEVAAAVAAAVVSVVVDVIPEAETVDEAEGKSIN